MALSGTLADIGIVELIQFPSNGRKTGELIIAGADDEARLYYTEGALNHVIVDEKTGMDALVEVVSWSTGEFEFRMGVENETRTIELDLHRALMLALKTRDELAEKARKVSDSGEEMAKDASMEKATSVLTEMVSASEAIGGAYLLSDEGEILAKSDADVTSDEETIKALLSQVATFYSDYKRPQLGRVFLDDEEGILHAARLGKGYIAVLAANKEASMGVVSMMMNKLLSGMVGM